MDSESDSHDEAKLFAVNTRMIPSKLACLVTGFCVGSYAPFLNVFFVSTGMSEFRAGTVNALQFVPSVIAGPIWGYLADYTGRRKLILIILCIGSSVSMFSMPWVARAIYPPSRFQCITIKYNETSVTLPTTSITEGECQRLKNEALSTLFSVLLAIITIASVFVLPLYSFMQTIIMNVIKSGEGRATYGGQAIFEAIGFSIANYVSGKVSEQYKEVDMPEYTGIFFLFLPCCLLLIPIGCYLITQVNYDVSATEDTENTRQRSREIVNTSLLKTVLHLCYKFEVVIFLFSVFIAGLANSVCISFSFMFLIDEMKRSKSETSFVIVSGIVGQAVMFPFTASLIKLLRGTIPAIIVGMFSYFVRLLGMSFDIPFEVFVCLQLLNGFGYALTLASIMEHVHTISPKEINMTMNAITMGIYFHLTQFVGNMGGSKIYESYGGANLFFGQSLCCGVWTVLMIIYHGGTKLAQTYFHIQQLATSPRDENNEINIEQKP